ILVRSDVKGRGRGRLLMERLIRYLRGHGTRRIVGTVLRENKGMLALVEKLGFAIRPHPEDPELRWVELSLQTGH
ncbi:MAG: GNAT family N-acetyltransferase, partial [Dehalococcoidia bacterium]|nr:GNAT family N-acetyltransferase [Dehalococcoidia bacterium]